MRVPPLVEARPDAVDCTDTEPFALMVLGDDMRPEFEHGDVIVVEPGGLAQHGSFVVARCGGDARDDVDVVDIVFGVGATTLPVDYRGALRDALAASLPWLGDGAHAGVFPLKTTPLDHVQALVSHRARLVLRLPRSRKEDALALCGRTLDIDGSLIVVGSARVRPIAASATLASAFVATGAVDELVHEQVVEQWLEDAGLPRRFVCGRLARLRCGSAQVAGGSLVLHGLSPEASLAVQRRGLGPQPLLGCGLFVPFKAIAVD